MIIIFVMLIRLFIHCFIFYYFWDIGYKNQDQLIFLLYIFRYSISNYNDLLCIYFNNYKLLIDIYNVSNSTTGPTSIGSKN